MIQKFGGVHIPWSSPWSIRDRSQWVNAFSILPWADSLEMHFIRRLWKSYLEPCRVFFPSACVFLYLSLTPALWGSYSKTNHQWWGFVSVSSLKESRLRFLIWSRAINKPKCTAKTGSFIALSHHKQILGLIFSSLFCGCWRCRAS